MMIPRDYQVQAVESIWKYFSNNTGNPLLCLPTGTGKSVIIALLLKKIFEAFPNQKVLMITHVKELIQQNFEKLKSVWNEAPVGVYSAGLKKRESQQKIIFCGIQSVAKKAELFGSVDLVVIDEAHLVSHNANSQYRNFIAKLKESNSYLKVIGLTATPFRSNFGLLTDAGIFTDIAFDITQKDEFVKLINQGYLSALVPFATNHKIDVSNVKITNGEFNQKELAKAVNVGDITEKILNDAIELAKNRNKWLIFSSGIEHGKEICECLNEKGILTTCVFGDLSNAERDRRIADFKTGKYKAIVNYGVLTTGFDCPEIDCIIMIRPTLSPVLWVQMLGRGTRPSANKENCLVLDYAGNTERLGAINDPKIPYKSKTKNKKQKQGEASQKICPMCNAANIAQNVYCWKCNYFFKGEKLNSVSSDLALIQKTFFHFVKVSKINITEYQKKGKPKCFKVDYYCGVYKMTEFLCPLHGGYAQDVFFKWTKAMLNADICDDITDENFASYIPLLLQHLNNKELFFILDFSKKYANVYARLIDGKWFSNLTPATMRQIENFEKIKHSKGVGVWSNLLNN